MRAPVTITAILTTIVSWSASGVSMEDLCPHFATNTSIVWRVPTNLLPKHLWVYKKLPRVFSAVAISNGVVLASFQGKGIPLPSTNQVVIWADHFEGEPRPPNFSIMPQWGQISYDLGDRAANSAEEFATNELAVRRALECASKLGVDLKELVPRNTASPGVYGVFLPRQIDGIEFFDETEGFSIRFDKRGKVQGFGLQWPTLERERSEPVASPEEIVACIRGYKTVMVPAESGPDSGPGYFTAVRRLGQARKLAIIGVKLYYGEGTYGEEPPNNEPSRCATPVAELEVTADFGTNSTVARLYSPILSSEVKRTLGSKAK